LTELTQKPSMLRVASAFPDFDIELMRLICEDLRLAWQSARYTGEDFNGVLDGLNDGSHDAVISGTTITPERERVAAYPCLKGVEHGAVGMISDMVRWGGLAGVAAGLMFVLSGILTLIAPPQTVLGSFNDYLIEVAIVVAFLSTLLTIAILHAVQCQSGRFGLVGAGSLLTFVGYAVVLVTVHLTKLAGGEPIFSVRLVGGLLVLVGSILLGAMTLYARVLPWWCGVLLIVGFPLGDFLNNVAEGSENIVLAMVWGLIGYALLSPRNTVAEQPSRAR
jgi:Bacterial extracellular solute-binding proteins, family 3